ncbi:hypothetical protein [Thermus thermophilus]|uniref:hypothetical protein n=1 Tax=Thermus thermophilus TaxID=274 RepID=UPI001165513D|nr:hypothetical protein [Thermus thermophilus]BBL94115.1 hypothetical protein TthHC11_16490 [Thermus thermophilus]BDG24536.1 hypothetical protein TthSNM33_17300 [Thermus thermophilus]BDG25791.1 hypothetical protein TthSNM66_04270 [Thermus thermophilus]
MKKAVVGVLALLAGLSLAQQVDYREAARAAAALARLQTVAEKASGEEKLLQWAQEVKARAERSYEAQDHFKALREAQAALLLYRAAQGALKEEGMGGEVRRDRPAPERGKPGLMARRHPGFGPGERREALVKAQAPKAVERAEKELAYYRGQDPLVRSLIAEAKARLDKEPGRAFLLAQAALALISAERGF